MTVPAPDVAPHVAGAGARHRELTLRAALAGVAIGVPLALSNLYLSLKTGWSDSGNFAATLASFFVFASLGRRLRLPYSMLENNTSQTIASAMCGVVAVAGMSSTVPALALLGAPLSTSQLVVWTLIGSLAALAMVLPLRGPLLRDARLPFPTGMVTSELITNLHRGSEFLLDRGRTLFGSAIAAGGVTWLRDGVPKILPPFLSSGAAIGGVSVRSLTLGVGTSPLMLGIGAVIGLKLSLSLGLGALLAWGTLGPILVNRHLVEEASYPALVTWLAWPASGVMLGATIVALAGERWRHAKETAPRGPTRSRDVAPRRAMVVFVIVAVVSSLFAGMRPLELAVGLALAAALVPVAVRSAGETDISPAGPLQQVALVPLCLLFIHHPAGALLASHVLAAGGIQGAWLLWSLRAGERLGASLERQTVAFAIGCVAGALVAVPAYLVLAKSGAVGSEAFPAPTARLLHSLVAASSAGMSALPRGAPTAVAIGITAGLVLGSARVSARRFAPSPVAMAVGMISPGYYAAAAVVGGVSAALYARRNPMMAERLTPVGAAGLIAGEAAVGILIAVLDGVGALGAHP